MFGLGSGEMVVVVVLVLLVFGPSQIPKMAKGLGQAMREFRKAQNEIHDEIHSDDPKSNRPPENKPLS